LVDKTLIPGACIALTENYKLTRDAFNWSDDESAAVELLAKQPTLDAFTDSAQLSLEHARAVVAGLVLLECASLISLQRSDPVEAAERRRRLIQRGMQNMGSGPFAGRTSVSAPAPSANAAPPPSPAAPAAAATKVEAKPANTVPPVAEAKPVVDTPETLRAAVEASITRATSKSYFERLGLGRDAKRDEVKKAFYAIAKRFHPDRFNGPEYTDLLPKVRDFFAAVNEAYETLGNDKKRAEYLKRNPR
jgi:hypothetical protein